MSCSIQIQNETQTYLSPVLNENLKFAELFAMQKKSLHSNETEITSTICY